MTSLNPKGVFLPESCFTGPLEHLRAFLRASNLLEQKKDDAGESLAPWLWRRADAEGLIESGVILKLSNLRLVIRQSDGRTIDIEGGRRAEMEKTGTAFEWLGD